MAKMYQAVDFQLHKTALILPYLVRLVKGKSFVGGAFGEHDKKFTYCRCIMENDVL